MRGEIARNKNQRKLGKKQEIKCAFLREDSVLCVLHEEICRKEEGRNANRREFKQERKNTKQYR